MKNAALFFLPFRAFAFLGSFEKFGFMLFSVFFTAGSLMGMDIAGRVVESFSGSVKVEVSSDFLPNPGDPMEVFFEMTGLPQGVLVATGKVSQVTENSVEVTIERAYGKVAKGQGVTISSTNPRKKGSPPSPAESSKPLAKAPDTSPKDTPMEGRQQLDKIPKTPSKDAPMEGRQQHEAPKLPPKDAPMEGRQQHDGNRKDKAAAADLSGTWMLRPSTSPPSTGILKVEGSKVTFQGNNLWTGTLKEDELIISRTTAGDDKGIWENVPDVTKQAVLQKNLKDRKCEYRLKVISPTKMKGDWFSPRFLWNENTGELHDYDPNDREDVEWEKTSPSTDWESTPMEGRQQHEAPKLPPKDAPMEGRQQSVKSDQWAGKWEGRYHNTRGEEGATSLVLTEGTNGEITGTWDGNRMENVKRHGNTLTWTCTGVAGGTREYTVQATISDDLSQVTTKYSATDHARTPHQYSGTEEMERPGTQKPLHLER